MIVARTDADAADMLISDADERDHEFLTGERTAEGFYRTNAGIEQAIARGIAYAPYGDLVWCETSEPDMEQAERFARELHEAHPGKLLAYNCSPSFNWKGKLDDDEIAGFQSKLGELGYVFQFITLAGFHTHQPLDVRARPRLPRARHDRVRGAPAGRVRQRGRGLHRGQAPARGRRELLRGGRDGDHRRRVRDHLREGLDRGVAVQRS